MKQELMPISADQVPALYAPTAPGGNPGLGVLRCQPAQREHPEGLCPISIRLRELVPGARPNRAAPGPADPRRGLH